MSVVWHGVRPLPRDTEEMTLRGLCMLYVAVLNPCKPDPVRGKVTLRCQGCGNVFQQESSKRLETRCEVCR